MINELIDRLESLFRPQVSYGTVGGRTVIGLSNRYEGYILDEASVVGAPDREIATVAVHDPESFVAYITRHGSSPAVFYRVDPPALTGVCDYHGGVEAGAEPGWGQHRVGLDFRYSRDFQEWSRLARDWVNQETAVTALENLADTIAEPDAATVQETIRTLTVTMRATFSDVRDELTGSIRLVMDETVKLLGANSAEVPRSIMIRVPVFEGGTLVNIPIKLRFKRPSGGGLLVFFDGQRAMNRAVELAVEDAVSQVSAGLEDVPFYRGHLASMSAPESSFRRL